MPEPVEPEKTLRVDPAEVLTSAADSILWLEDVSDEALVSFASQQSESRFRAVFEAASVGIALTSVDGLLFMANRCFCEMVQATEKSLKARSLASLVVDEDQPRHREAMQKLLSHGVQLAPWEQGLRRVDGTVVPVRATSSVIQDAAGVPHTIVMVVENLTELKRLERDRAEKERLQNEMNLVRRIQLSILPRSIEVEGFEVAARTEAAERVGGDYYDVLPTADGAWIAIGDVTGHGLSSGIIMLTVQSAMAALTQDRPAAGPAEVLAVLNRVLFENIHHRMLTHDYVTLSLIRAFNDGRVVVAGAHDDIIVYRARQRRCQTIPTTGTWMGLINEVSEHIHDASFTLDDGDLMVLFTDGVSEATDAQGHAFGAERICETLTEAGGESPDRIVERLMSRADAWSPTPTDDRTVMAVRYRGRSSRNR